MLDRIISDVDKALDAEAYLSALALMMTIPDICAKAEYGGKSRNKERYVKWFDEHIGQYNRPPCEEHEIQTPYISGEGAYQLRCSVLHEGNTDIDKSEIDEERNKIDSFTLAVEKKKPFDIYVDSSEVTSDSNGVVEHRAYKVNIRQLWLQIRETAMHFYEKHKDKFDFLNYKIINWDEITERRSNK